MQLSILIATMPQRENELKRLLDILEPQLTDTVELLIDNTEAPQGDKLNVLIKKATGKYITCFDDDDFVSTKYIDTVLPHTYKDYDYIGYKITVTKNGEYIMSLTEHTDNEKPYVNMKCIIKKDIALRFRMNNLSTGDNHWARQISTQIKTYHFINKYLYHYDYWETKSIGPDIRAKYV